MWIQFIVGYDAPTAQIVRAEAIAEANQQVGQDVKHRTRQRTGPARDWSMWLLLGTVGGMLAVSLALAGWLYLGHVGAPPVVAIEVSVDDEEAASRDAARDMERAERSVSANGILTLDIERFRIGMGRYPRSIDELTERPADLTENQRWDGPYVNNPELLLDPWENPYQYAAPGKHNTETYDLWSTGPDGISDNEDDLGNW